MFRRKIALASASLFVVACSSKPRPEPAAPEPAPTTPIFEPDESESPPSPDVPSTGGTTPPTASGPECGGYAGRQCPEGLDCVDDPGDGCDPTRGGRDCGGLCRAASEGVKCGKSTCAQGQVCCNASCGVCTPPGGQCTQQFCN